MKYLVIFLDREKKEEKKLFKTCRDAFCFATNYKKVKESKVFKDNQLIAKFKY